MEALVVDCEINQSSTSNQKRLEDALRDEDVKYQRHEVISGKNAHFLEKESTSCALSPYHCRSLQKLNSEYAARAPGITRSPRHGVGTLVENSGWASRLPHATWRFLWLSGSGSWALARALDLDLARRARGLGQHRLSGGPRLTDEQTD